MWNMTPRKKIERSKCTRHRNLGWMGEWGGSSEFKIGVGALDLWLKEETHNHKVVRSNPDTGY